MKRFIAATAILAVFVLAVLNDRHAPVRPDTTESVELVTAVPSGRIPQYRQAAEGSSLPLEFAPVQTDPLTLGKPSDRMSLVKSLAIPSEKGLPPCKLLFYTEKEYPGLIDAFLEDRWDVYDLGIVSGENMNSVKTSISHLRENGLSEIKLEGPDHAVQLLYLDTQVSKWERMDFQDHPVESLDLDGDGQKEWVGNLLEAVPPFVEVYRWNAAVNGFEAAAADRTAMKMHNVDMTTVPVYSYLFRENGQWLIESGTEELYDFFRYDHGNLVETGVKITRSRLLELRSIQTHKH